MPYGEYLNSTDVWVFVADSLLQDSTGFLCVDSLGPYTADCTPVCDVNIDTAYTSCTTDSTFEVVVIIGGTPGGPDGFTLYNSVGDTVTNVFPDTLAFGSHLNGTYVDIYLLDEFFGPNCVVFIDSLTFMPDSANQVCDTTANNIAGRVQNFQTSMTNNSVSLSWQTMAKAENIFFEVERRTSQRPFAVIGERQMNDMDASSHQFSFKDYDLEANTLYSYRIKQVRHDGVKTYSPILTALMPGEAEVMFGNVFPNPSSGTAKIKLNALYAHQMSCDLMDMRGAVVATSVMNTIGGVQEIELPVADLKPGIYIVRFQLENGEIFVRKMLIQE